MTDRVFRSDTAGRLARFSRNGAGAVRVPVTPSRTGVQLYPGKGPNGSTLREYRPPEEVFAADALASFAGVPLTVGHPSTGVSPDNAQKLQVGHVSDLPPEAHVKLDGSPYEWVRAHVYVSDGATLDDIEHSTEPVEVSCGYECVLDMTPGVSPEGEPYDAIQRNIRLNHLAIKVKARAGTDARLRLDSNQQETMKKIVIDGVELDYGSDAHLNVLQSKADAALKAEKDRADREAARADSEKARADKAEAELTPAKLDSRVEARLNLLRAAAPFLKPEYETSGKSNLEICKDALAAAGVSVEGKSDAYIEARFDGLTAKDQPAQFHNPGKSTPRADAQTQDSDDAFRAALLKKLDEESK